MLTIDDRDILDFKICLVKDLEKKIKMGYKSQFRNIVIKISSIPKRYKKIKAPVNVSGDIQKLETINKNIYDYLLDMFDVFGDNAVLNAKRIFEENGTKWGKKFYKSFKLNIPETNTKDLITKLYLELKDIDYLSLENDKISWIFKKTCQSQDLNSHSTRYFNTLYEIKSIWLQHFIQALTPNFTSVFEITEENENQIITNIIIKEGQ